jgi:uncharacterized repeat protein (TIGR03803 family)
MTSPCALLTLQSACTQKTAKIKPGLATLCGVLLFCIAATNPLHAQTFTTRASFDSNNGQYPLSSLIQGTDGNIYGTTFSGGFYDFGTVFKMSQEGTLKRIYEFCSHTGCLDGTGPGAGLIQGVDGNFYGTTQYGGTSGNGTVFKITSLGVLTTLYSFDGTHGAIPMAALVQHPNGDFYGTTISGGPNGSHGGTIFKITSSGALSVLHTFAGETPYGLALAEDGAFYGTTYSGGTHLTGTVFKITAGGNFTTLYNFCQQTGCGDGGLPNTGLAEGINGSFYGTTGFGGLNGFGTIYEITPQGSLTTLYNFEFEGAEASSAAALIQATNGNFYATTTDGGLTVPTCEFGCGTLFEVSPGGVFTTVHEFCIETNCEDGSQPHAGLLQATNGSLYGTTYFGGSLGYGTIFSISLGLRPFVKVNPSAGEIGSSVVILGNNLASTTEVTFNGTTAIFTASSSAITATVPAGATTGMVQVTGAYGTLNSNTKFHVVQ